MPVPPRAPRRLVAVSALTSVVLILAGCSPAGTGAAVEPTAPPTSAAPSPAIPTPTAAPVALTLAFGGDVHFTGRNAALLNDPSTAVGEFAGRLAAADFAMVNLESAVTTRGMKEAEMGKVGQLIGQALDSANDDAALARVRGQVKELAVSFPLYASMLRG